MGNLSAVNAGAVDRAAATVLDIGGRINAFVALDESVHFIKALVKAGRASSRVPVVVATLVLAPAIAALWLLRGRRGVGRRRSVRRGRRRRAALEANGPGPALLRARRSGLRLARCRFGEGVLGHTAALLGVEVPLIRTANTLRR